ncbi:MAG: PLD nuclease N-terminal domain-containing protein, partial [Trebonia sp.]
MTPTILIFALVVAAAICLDVYCLVDLRRSRVRHLSKWGWALVICVSNPWGGLAYLIFGRDGTG